MKQKDPEIDEIGSW